MSSADVARHRLVLPLLVIGAGAVLAQQSDVTRNPLGNNAAAAAAGRLVYDQTCQACHGPAGQGDRGPALTSGTFTRGNDDGDLFRAIRDGVQGSQMPPFRGLSDEQVWQLVSYLRSLSIARPSEPAASVSGIARPAKPCSLRRPGAQAAIK